VKELGCQIVTPRALFTARWYPPRDTQSRGPSLIPQTATFCIEMDNPKDSSFAAKIKKNKKHEKYIQHFVLREQE